MDLRRVYEMGIDWGTTEGRCQSPRGRRVCAFATKRSRRVVTWTLLYSLQACSRRWHSTDRFCLPTRSLTPPHGAVPCTTEGSFFGVTGSRHIPSSRAKSSATSRGGYLEILHVPQ
ncbi:PREDICTED: uncharacterized protein LOC108761148 [Trachymyrmex cornetzi]|uniref:uncharacterized protein LOC108761148 n=1 Tax=Trachymyrmex cornetzi TaxID=471704 RepID=UPI00084ED361|nr:PREDICTED: uncharacterized protein LOC108761148 [Trachymyrmex cornetzi]